MKYRRSTKISQVQHYGTIEEEMFICPGTFRENVRDNKFT
jgi:hypothetical protein